MARLLRSTRARARALSASQRHLRAQDQGLVAGQAEVLDRARGVPRHGDEELLAPPLHDRGRGRRDRDARDEVRSVLQVEAALEQAVLAADAQGLRHTQLVVVADADRDVEDLAQTAPQYFDRVAVEVV